MKKYANSLEEFTVGDIVRYNCRSNVENAFFCLVKSVYIDTGKLEVIILYDRWDEWSCGDVKIWRIDFSDKDELDSWQIIC
jgi:hypothetical protein